MFRKYLFRPCLRGIMTVVAVGFFCLVMVTAEAYGQEGTEAEAKTVVKEHCQRLRKFSSADADKISALLSACNTREAVDGLLRLASGAAQEVRDKHLPRSARMNAAEACAAAWELALYLSNNSGNDALRERLLVSWDKELTDDGFAVCQLSALSGVFIREFLTQRFWQLFKGSRNPYFIGAACYILAEFGVKEDLSALEEKERLTKSEAVRGDIQGAINYIKYHSQKRKDWNIPSQPPPKMPKIEDVLKDEKTQVGSPIGRMLKNPLSQ